VPRHAHVHHRRSSEPLAVFGAIFQLLPDFARGPVGRMDVVAIFDDDVREPAVQRHRRLIRSPRVPHGKGTLPNVSIEIEEDERVPFQITHGAAAYERIDRLPVTVLLENLRSAYNVGSFFRTADAVRAAKLD